MSKTEAKIPQLQSETQNVMLEILSSCHVIIREG